MFLYKKFKVQFCSTWNQIKPYESGNKKMFANNFVINLICVYWPHSQPTQPSSSQIVRNYSPIDYYLVNASHQSFLKFLNPKQKKTKLLWWALVSQNPLYLLIYYQLAIYSPGQQKKNQLLSPHMRYWAGI